MGVTGFNADAAPPKAGLQCHGLRQAHPVVGTHVDEIQRWSIVAAAVGVDLEL